MLAGFSGLLSRIASLWDSFSLFSSAPVPNRFVMGQLLAVFFRSCPESPRYGTASRCFLPLLSRIASLWDSFSLFSSAPVPNRLVMGQLLAVFFRSCPESLRYGTAPRCFLGLLSRIVSLWDTFSFFSQAPVPNRLVMGQLLASFLGLLS